MIEHLRLSPSVLAALVACGDENSTTDPESWRSVGYGYYVEVRDGRAKAFHVTDATFDGLALVKQPLSDTDLELTSFEPSQQGAILRVEVDVVA